MRSVRMVGLVIGLFLLSACGGGNDTQDQSKDGGYNFVDDDSRSGDLRNGSDLGNEDSGGQDTGGEDGKLQPCSGDEACSGETPFCEEGSCVECREDSNCGGINSCEDHKCVERACWPGTTTCVANAVHTCSPEGDNPDWQVDECGSKSCIGGECLTCKPNEKSCSDDKVMQCNADGSELTLVEQCGEGTQCIGAQCMVCYPGTKQCQDQKAMACKGDGSGWDLIEDCGAGSMACVNGLCLDPCSGDGKVASNAGCEFFAVDLHNAVDGEYNAQDAQFAVIASNTSSVAEAVVTITYPDGNTQVKTVAPLSLQKFLIPKTWGLTGTQKGKNGIHIKSTYPITAYQFNPLSNFGVFSNDASLLLPITGMDKEYYVATYIQTGNFSSYFVVVGTQEQTTQVTFTVTAKTKSGSGVPALDPGDSYTISLGKGELVAVEAEAVTNADLSGSHISATAPVVVFGGHTAANTGNVCCADHLEQQLAPTSTWGHHYMVVKSYPRWQEKDYVRVFASQDGTRISLNPLVIPPTQLPVLDAGEYFTFRTDTNVEITATAEDGSYRPIQVVQYLAASQEIAPSVSYQSCTSDASCPQGHTCEGNFCSPIGDPAMMVAVPEGQFLDSYIFLTPDSYLEDYLSVIAPLSVEGVTLDGELLPISEFTPVGSSGYGAYRTPVDDGVHEISCSKPIGIMVYGYDAYVSYGYPGGQGLAKPE